MFYTYILRIKGLESPFWWAVGEGLRRHAGNRSGSFGGRSGSGARAHRVWLSEYDSFISSHDQDNLVCIDSWSLDAKDAKAKRHPRPTSDQVILPKEVSSETKSAADWPSPKITRLYQ